MVMRVWREFQCENARKAFWASLGSNRTFFPTRKSLLMAVDFQGTSAIPVTEINGDEMFTLRSAQIYASGDAVTLGTGALSTAFHNNRAVLSGAAEVSVLTADSTVGNFGTINGVVTAVDYAPGAAGLHFLTNHGDISSSGKAIGMQGNSDMSLYRGEPDPCDRNGLRVQHRPVRDDGGWRRRCRDPGGRCRRPDHGRLRSVNVQP